MSPPKREMHDNPVGTVARERRRKNGEGGGKQKGTGDITQAAAAPPPQGRRASQAHCMDPLEKKRSDTHKTNGGK